MAAALPAARERAHFLYTTTQMSLIDIAVEAGVWDRTVHRWAKQGGWERPSGGTKPPPKIPPEKLEPTRRLFVSGASVNDVALLLDCDNAYLYNFARKCGWTEEAMELELRQEGLSEEEIALHFGTARPDEPSSGSLTRALDQSNT